MSAAFTKSGRFFRLFMEYTRRLHLLRNGLRTSKQSQRTFSKPKVQWMLTIPFVTTVHCWSIPGLGYWSTKKEEIDTQKKQESAPTVSPIVVEADRLYAENEFQKLYEFLIQHKDSNDAEVLWRLARAARDVGKVTKEADKKKLLYNQGLEYVTKALEIDGENFAVHKWYAILLNYTGELEGTKQKIANAMTVKEHFLRAAELNPSDATTVHSLGFWFYSFADLKWYERKVASALYGELPTGSYQMALEYFLKAEEIEPNFYSMNLAMVGQTYMKLQDAKKAYIYLARAYHYPIKTADDKEAHALADKLLRSLGVKGTPRLDAFSADDSNNSEKMSQ